MTFNSDIFPELNHELIIPLQPFSDQELWQFWTTYPHQHRYLVMIFFRYAFFPCQVVSSENNIELSATYLELLWFFIFDRINEYQEDKTIILSELIANLTKQFLWEERLIISSTNSQKDNSELRYFPLKYYLENNLDRLSNLERMILVVKDKFNWEDETISQYLQQQKQRITLAEIKAYYTQAHSHLINNLPIDIISIYLS